MNFNIILKNKKLFFLGLFFAIFLGFIDIASKRMIFELIENQENQKNFIEITGFFNLVTVLNHGVSFGMFNNLENSQIIFSILVSIICLILIIWLYKNDKTYLAIAISLIIGGAFGNLYDRITQGAVADFLDFHIYGYHWPAFNLADSFVFIGVALLIFEDIIIKNNKDKK